MSESGFTFVLPVQGQPLRIGFTEFEPEITSLSGKELRRFQIHFTVAGDDRNDEVSAVLNAANNGTELISDTEGGRWRVGHRMMSVQGDQMYSHTVELEEHEVLDLTGVEIDGMTLTPERWKMEPSNMLTFLVSMDAEASRQFEQILERHYYSDAEEPHFPARLAGASETPASWRFGACVWQSLEDGGTRHLIRLVSEASDNDDDAGPGLFQPERTRLTQQSAMTKIRLDALIEELRVAGVLDAEALARISPKLTAVPFAALREFDRANDIDVFFE